MREWSVVYPECPGVVGRPSQLSVSGGRPSRMSRSGREALSNVQEWREAFPDVREWSGGSPGCPKIFGWLSRMSKSCW